MPVMQSWDEHIARRDAAARAAYIRMVCAEGLFGKAFFGHKTTREERERMGLLWKQARKECGF